MSKTTKEIIIEELESWQRSSINKKWCSEEEVEKHYIDKQRVKEAIYKCEGEYKEYKGATRLAHRLLKELGLD